MHNMCYLDQSVLSKCFIQNGREVNVSQTSLVQNVALYWKFHLVNAEEVPINFVPVFA